ncbi:MAG: helix-turn-helix transcriptional regulator [Anaerolineae bacterium]|nr:helix-turn-helix transcriptional regulator [Anaerolineae bacterium]
MTADKTYTDDELKAWLMDLLGRVARAIVAVVGSSCEVVIHDFSDLEHSAVMIVGDISGRQPGAPVPDLEFVADSQNDESPDQLNYKIVINDQQYQSSTLWVRNPQGHIIGAMCINMDYSKYTRMQGLLEELTSVLRTSDSRVVTNSFAKNLDDLLARVVNQYTQQHKISSVESMSLQEKMDMIQIVEKNGLFKLRGASQRLAEMLNVSRASIYNYRAGAMEKDATKQ